MTRRLVAEAALKIYRIIFLVSLAIISTASAETPKVNGNAKFWGNWKDLRETEKWKSLESATNVMREANAPAGEPASKKESVRDQYIFNMSVDQPQEVAKFVAKVATSKIDGADGALSTVVNMRTSPAARKAAEVYVPPEARKDYLAMVERIPPGRYFSDPFAGTATTSAFVAASRPAGPTGYVAVKGPSMGCPAR